MRQYEDRRQARRYLYSIPALLVVLVLVGVLGRATWRSYLGAELAQENVGAVKSEKTELIERTTALQSDLSKLESERGMEEVIRDKFAVGKAGEGVIILVDKENDDSLNDAEQLSMWQKFLNLFK